MDLLAQANQHVKDRIAELEKKAAGDDDKLNRLIREDEKLKELKATRDSLVQAQSSPGITEVLNQIVQEVRELHADVKQVKRKQQEADLARLDVWSESKRSKVEQQTFKTELINYYQRQDPNNADNVLCMVLNKPLPRSEVTASHIYKHAFPSNLEAFGLDQADIHNPRNGLLLAKTIEHAFGVKHICFLYNPIAQLFIVRVLNPALLGKQIHPAYTATFSDVNDKPLQLPAGVFPWRRLLGFHARCCYRFARQIQWITADEHDHFTQYENFVLRSQGAAEPEAFEDDE